MDLTLSREVNRQGQRNRAIDSHFDVHFFNFIIVFVYFNDQEFQLQTLKSAITTVTCRYEIEIV